MKKYNNGTFTIKNVGEKVELYGWVSKTRNLGGLIFIDLRDRSGIIQLALRPENKCYEIADTLRNEYVIKVNGTIVERENKNLNISTGEVEVDVEFLEIINKSAELPFSISDDVTALEDTRLKYRYLDLRRSNIQSNLILRHKVCLITRNYLSDLVFLELETPILCKSTPEGARDYLVPSRVFNGKFYALPQSPQIYKQLLMIGGMEKYFQIARCSSSTLPFIMNGTASHNPRNCTTSSNYKGDNRFTGKTYFFEDRVKHNTNACHVTAIFQKCN